MKFRHLCSGIFRSFAGDVRRMDGLFQLLLHINSL